MSSTWRHLVRPDGDFCRIANLDGSLDNVSDEGLTRLHSFDPEEGQPTDLVHAAEAASFCTGNGPLMTVVWMELCLACDAHRSAAYAFIRWYRDPKALPQL